MPAPARTRAGNTCDDEHARQHQHQGDRGPEVRLEQDQAGEDGRQHPDRTPELAEGLRRPVPREIRSDRHEQRQLRELRRLERGRPEIEPALGTVDLRRDDEHRQAEAERRQDERRRELAQLPVVEARGEEHQRDADECVDALPLEEGDRVALPERGGRRGGAVDHHEPERDERQRHEHEQALLELTSLRTLHL